MRERGHSGRCLHISACILRCVCARVHVCTCSCSCACAYACNTCVCLRMLHCTFSISVHLPIPYWPYTEGGVWRRIFLEFSQYQNCQYGYAYAFASKPLTNPYSPITHPTQNPLKHVHAHTQAPAPTPAFTHIHIRIRTAAYTRTTALAANALCQRTWSYSAPPHSTHSPDSRLWARRGREVG